MPIVLFAAALGSAAVLHYLAERGRQTQPGRPQPGETQLEPETRPQPPQTPGTDPTLRRDARTGEWRL